MGIFFFCEGRGSFHTKIRMLKVPESSVCGNEKGSQKEVCGLHIWHYAKGCTIPIFQMKLTTQELSYNDTEL